MLTVLRVHEPVAFWIPFNVIRLYLSDVASMNTAMSASNARTFADVIKKPKTFADVLFATVANFSKKMSPIEGIITTLFTRSVLVEMFVDTRLGMVASPTESDPKDTLVA